MAVKTPVAVKGLALIFFLCIAVRLISQVAPDTQPLARLSGLCSNTRFVEAVLDFEFGKSMRPDGTFGLVAAVFGPTIRTAIPDNERSAEVMAPSPDVTAPAVQPSYPVNPSDTPLYYALPDEPEETPLSTASPNVISEHAETYTDITLDNRAGYCVDIPALLTAPIGFTISQDAPSVLIIHTHGSEAYLPDGDDQYVESDPYRTQEKAQSVIRVGDELAAVFASNGVNVIHDRNVYDYPSYQGSYTRSYEAIQSYLSEYPSIKIVIDLHRNHIEDDDGNIYKTLAQINDAKCAQILFVMGTDAYGLEHPDWQENFKLALRIENEMNELYPSLAKPVELSQYRYNQQATTGSMLVEVGSTGNTLQEALDAARYFGEAASNVLLELAG